MHSACKIALHDGNYVPPRQCMAAKNKASQTLAKQMATVMHLRRVLASSRVAFKINTRFSNCVPRCGRQREFFYGPSDAVLVRWLTRRPCRHLRARLGDGEQHAFHNFRIGALPAPGAPQCLIRRQRRHA